MSHPAAGTLTTSERDWLTVRTYLTEHRYDLAVDAAEDYPPDRRLAGTPLLAAPGWLPPAPIPLQDIGLELRGAAPAEVQATSPLLPRRADGTPYRRYSEAMGELAAPAVFENRVTYRLTEADLRSRPSRLVFAAGRYFDGIDTGEAAAHEYAAARLGRPAGGLRARFADPCDLRRRPANLAISTLTLRLDRRQGRARFLLHWRDPAKVGHAGGLYQVVPAGVFQPSGEAAWNWRNDFSLWRCMIREFAEVGPSLGYDCAWLDRDAVLVKSHAAQPDGLIGGLWSGTELTVDPRQILQSLPTFLAERCGVRFHFGTLVTGIASHSEAKTVGRLGLKSLLYFETLTTIALFIGLVADINHKNLSQGHSHGQVIVRARQGQPFLAVGLHHGPEQRGFA